MIRKNYVMTVKDIKFFEYKSHKIAQRLREIDGKAEQFRIKGRTVRCWSVPAFAKIEDGFQSRFDEEDVPF